MQKTFLYYWLQGNIVFFDGVKCIEAFGGGHPSGISMDRTGKYVL